MTNNAKRTLDEPQIRQLLAGLVHSGKRYYRLNVPVAARAELLKLVSNATASRLLREAVKAGLIVEEKIDHGTSESQVGTCDTRAAEKEAAVVADATDEDIEEDGEEQDESGSRATSKLPLGLGDIPKGNLYRFDLIKRGEWWGIVDNLYDHLELISRDRCETLEELYARRRGHRDGDCFRWSEVLQKTA